MTQLRRRFAYAVLTRALRRAFRRVVWVGDWNPPPDDAPVILYSNHHAFYDAQIFGFLGSLMKELHVTGLSFESFNVPKDGRLTIENVTGHNPVPGESTLMNARPDVRELGGIVSRVIE